MKTNAKLWKIENPGTAFNEVKAFLPRSCIENL